MLQGFPGRRLLIGVENRRPPLFLFRDPLGDRGRDKEKNKKAKISKEELASRCACTPFQLEMSDGPVRGYIRVTCLQRAAALHPTQLSIVFLVHQIFSDGEGALGSL